MSISVLNDKAGSSVTISIIGNFDFSLFNDFKESYINSVGQYTVYRIELHQVEYLDSAALGMLLSMRSSLGNGCTIELCGANDFIRNILKISRFDKLFVIV
ncbi:STAS domain-containing protein [Marinomonas algicola]|uniref:STAS domain-containing protein n=1 Tax=Marinomonas algicola TaxID=2773454 RepID=UPI00174D396D|nr:STAS domain-containing protein [Marinomonas algicola]